MPTDLGRYYEHGYGAYSHPNSVTEMGPALDKVRFRINMVMQFKPAGSLLEIGPSFGAFSYLAQQNGFQVTALEMDKECVAFMKNTLRINAIQVDSIELALAKLGTFDVICMWHSLEHLANPGALLAAIVRKLNPNGILVIACPNPDSLQARVLGRLWTHLDAPRHVWLGSSRFLRRILAELGCTEIMCTASDPDSLHLTDYGWAASLGSLSKNKIGKFLGRVFGTAIRFAAYPFRKKIGMAAGFIAIYSS